MRAKVLAAALAAALALVPTAYAHTEGGGTHATGSFTLQPAGSAGYAFETTLAEMNLTAVAGRVLAWNWSVRAGGPAVYFDIHSHPSGQVVRHHFTTAAEDTGTWALPGSDTYWLYWRNPANVPVEVEYTFEVLPPAQDAPLLWLVPLVAIGGVVAILAIALRRRPRKNTGDAEEPERP